MSHSNRQQQSGSLFSIFLIATSMVTLFLFYATIWTLSSSVVNQTGVITRTRVVIALTLMLIGMISITIGGSLFLIDT